jgi:elongation factor G
MDRVGADFAKVVEMIRGRLGANALPIQIPVGAEDTFRGIVDLIGMQAMMYDADTPGAEFSAGDIPAGIRDEARAAREKLIESLADVDDAIMKKYLEGAAFSRGEITAALRRQTLTMKVIPVCCGAAFKNKGIQPLLDAVVDFLPSPADMPPVTGKGKKDAEIRRAASDDEPFAALAFKIVTDPYVGQLTYFRVYSGALDAGSTIFNATKKKRERIGRILKMHANKREDIREARTGDIAAAVGLSSTATGDTLCDPDHPIVLETLSFPEPVIAIAIEPRTRADEEKMGLALEKIQKEDPSFRVRVDRETGQTLISGMGELHLEIIVDRLSREFGLGATIGKPRVAYKETIRKAVRTEGRFIRQSGGRGQFGHVWLEMEPNEPGKGLAFESRVVGGRVPREYIPAVEKGIVEAMEEGVLAGYPVVDVKVAVVDGSCHEVDSSELAFKIAASMGFKSGARRAHPVLLEPVMSVEVVVPKEYLGDVIGNLTSRRGKIVSIESRPGSEAIQAEVPLAEMFGYATDLRSKTQGRATYTMQFLNYATVSEERARDIIEKKKN